MNLEEELDKLIDIVSRRATGRGEDNNSLEKTRRILSLYGNPHEKLKIVHVVGTNGKGSTVNGLREILMNSGYRAGIITSPHLVDFNERIQINREKISIEKVVHLMGDLLKKCDENKIEYPSFPVTMAVISLVYFYENNVDVVLLEASVGGKYDPSNVVTPIVSVITNIGLDHLHILGGNIEGVSEHKLGIIKNNIPVVTGIENEVALELLKDKVSTHSNDCYLINENLNYKIKGQDERGRYIVDYFGTGLSKTYNNIVLNMLGEHQVKNTLIIIKVLEVLELNGFFIDEKVLRDTLDTLVWEGRLEFLKHNIIVDGSHNIDGINALVEVMENQLKSKYKKIIILTSSVKNKDFENNIIHFYNLSNKLYITQMNKSRSIDLEEFKLQVEHFLTDDVYYIKDVKEAYDKIIKEELTEDTLLLITGSLYLVGEVKTLLKEYN